MQFVLKMLQNTSMQFQDSQMSLIRKREGIENYDSLEVLNILYQTITNSHSYLMGYYYYPDFTDEKSGDLEINQLTNKLPSWI